MKRGLMGLLIVLAVVVVIMNLSLMSGCTTVKSGYVQKEYKFGSVGSAQTLAQQNAIKEINTPKTPTQNTVSNSNTNSNTNSTFATQSNSNGSLQNSPTQSTVKNVTYAKPTSVSLVKQNTSSSTKANTSSSQTTQSKTVITTDYYEYPNSNVIRITGTKNIDYTIDGTHYLFSNPRVDTDQTICILSISGETAVLEKDNPYSFHGFVLKLRDARSTNQAEYNFCEVSINR